MDVDRATSWLETMHASDSGPDPNTVNWRRCASEGELCDCSYQKSAVRLIRYGSPAESETGDRKWQWDYAHVEATADVLLCHPLSFMHRDPAPASSSLECAPPGEPSPRLGGVRHEVVIPANRTQIGAPRPHPNRASPGAAPAGSARTPAGVPESALDALAAMAPSRAPARRGGFRRDATAAMDAMAREETRRQVRRARRRRRCARWRRGSPAAADLDRWRPVGGARAGRW